MRAALPVRLPRRDPRARPRCLAHQQTAAVQDAAAATTSTSARACCILTEPTPPVRYSQAPPVRYSLVGCNVLPAPRLERDGKGGGGGGGGGVDRGNRLSTPRTTCSVAPALRLRCPPALLAPASFPRHARVTRPARPQARGGSCARPGAMSCGGARPSHRAHHAGPRPGFTLHSRVCAMHSTHSMALTTGARCTRTAARSWQLCLETAARGAAPGCKDVQVYACGRGHAVRRASRPVAGGERRAPPCLILPCAGVGVLCSMCGQVLVLGNGCAGAENQCVGLLLQMLHASRGKCNLRPGSQLQRSLDALSPLATDSAVQLQGYVSCICSLR